MALSSCNNKSKNVPCQIIVYDEATFTKSYLINYNGKDSIETTCGALSFDITDKLVYNQEINMKEVKFRTIYLHKSQKITRKQNDSLQTIICQLLSNPTTDTIRHSCLHSEVSILQLGSRQEGQVRILLL